MKVFKLEIEIRGDDLTGDETGEIARILRRVANKMGNSYPPFAARDTNGNRVGFAKFIERGK